MRPQPRGASIDECGAETPLQAGYVAAFVKTPLIFSSPATDRSSPARGCLRLGAFCLPTQTIVRHAVNSAAFCRDLSLGFTTAITSHRRQVSVKTRSDYGIEPGAPVLRAEDDVQNHLAKGLWHNKDRFEALTGRSL